MTGLTGHKKRLKFRVLRTRSQDVRAHHKTPTPSGDDLYAHFQNIKPFKLHRTTSSHKLYMPFDILSSKFLNSEAELRSIRSLQHLMRS
jgi:hypothetical protein